METYVMMRLDKFLTTTTKYSRSEVKKIIGKGNVSVNGAVIKSIDFKVNEESDEVSCLGIPCCYKKNVYYMLNKPANYICANEDSKYPTVIELFPEEVRRKIFSVGRLDIDTEGLLIVTDDGDLSHRLTSPKKNVTKVYFAKVKGIAKPEYNDIFKAGIDFKEFTSKPAEYKIISVDEDNEASEVLMYVTEGKFHQVKRMLHHVGLEVNYLKRISIGNLLLDDSLAPGEFRELTSTELEMIR
jgi:16S rRNA pseudouridine516 synthase